MLEIVDLFINKLQDWKKNVMLICYYFSCFVILYDLLTKYSFKREVCCTQREFPSNHILLGLGRVHPGQVASPSLQEELMK